MRNLIAGLTLTAAASLCAYPALAEEWQWFPVKGGAVAFDEDSLKTDVTTGVVAGNTMIFYDPPRPVGGGSYSFVAERLEFECRSDRHRWSQSAILDADGGIITSRDDGDWTRIDTEKGSTGLFKRMLCMAQTPPGGQQAKDLEALIVAVRANVPIAPPPAKPADTPTPAAPTPKTAAVPAAKPAQKTVSGSKPPPLDLDALVANLNAVAEAKANLTTPTLPAPVETPAPVKAPIKKAPTAKAATAKAKAPPPPTKPPLKLRPLTNP